jgi:hypothetical protein
MEASSLTMADLQGMSDMHRLTLPSLITIDMYDVKESEAPYIM